MLIFLITLASSAGTCNIDSLNGESRALILGNKTTISDIRDVIGRQYRLLNDDKMCFDADLAMEGATYTAIATCNIDFLNGESRALTLGNKTTISDIRDVIGRQYRLLNNNTMCFDADLAIEGATYTAIATSVREVILINYRDTLRFFMDAESTLADLYEKLKEFKIFCISKYNALPSDNRNKENAKSRIVDCFNIGDNVFEAGFDRDHTREGMSGIASHVRLQDIRDWLLRRDEFEYPRSCSLWIWAITETTPDNSMPESFEVHEHLESFFTD